MASGTKVVTLSAGLSELQLHLYKTILARDLEIINNETSVNDATLLGTVMQLKQCCSHPYLFADMEKEQIAKEKSQSLQPDSSTTHHLIKHCGKLLIIDELITNIVNQDKEENTKILLCSHIKEMFEWFEAYCNQRGISYHTITEPSAQSASQSNKHYDILIHHTPNQNAFHQTIPLMSDVDTVIFYDTDWTTKGEENAIISMLEETQKVSVYKICTMDTLEEKLCSMEQKTKLNTKELKALIRYKATKILNILSKSTLDTAQGASHSTIEDDDDEEVELRKTYTLKDIINHPENQGVIRVFVVFFLAMIIVPVVIVIYLNKYVMEHILFDWTDSAKQNITIVIGIAIAHIIGLMYVCYAWSGEDRIPAHILDEDQVAEIKEEDEQPTNVKKEVIGDEDSGSRQVGKNATNTLRKRKIK